MLPSPEAEPDRYRGRPLLIILEHYVLDCVGALAPEQQQSVAQVVRQVFGGGEDWKATVRATLKLKDSLDAEIRTMWDRNQQAAAQQNVTLHPVQFAKIVVDQNFAHLITTPTA